MFAATIACDFTGGSTDGTSVITLGYSFTVNSPVRVTDLGYWDFANDGFSSSHQIGIWDTSGALLTSTTIAAGPSGTLLNGFRYVSLATPLGLAAGDYVIGGNIGSDGYVQDDAGYFGPNFQFDVAAVPVPAAYACLVQVFWVRSG